MRRNELPAALAAANPITPAEELSPSLERAAFALGDAILSYRDDEVVQPAPDHRRDPDRQASRGRRDRPTPRLALGALALAAVVIIGLLIGLPDGGHGGDRVAGVLDNVAAAAAAQPSAAADLPYSFLKTREMSVVTTVAHRKAWSVFESKTREEWAAEDGSGSLRVVADKPRFVGPRDRAEWEAAGKPNFLAHGFEGGQTEDHAVPAGTLGGSIEGLPTDPGMLATRLRGEAEGHHGQVPVAAATLDLIAEDLRDPDASPELRQALYEAAEQVPGIEYLGEKTDPEGRSGDAVGVTSSYSGAPEVYSLIFDPKTGEVLATETTLLAPAGFADSQGSLVLAATVYLDSRKVEQTGA
jgi:hypothetical protein